jgi:hypothetical protein
MVCLKEYIFFRRRLKKCLAQVMLRDRHQQVYQRISHHYVYILIKIKKSNQVLKKEEAKSASLGKPDGPVSQTGTSDFYRIETFLDKEDDCSTPSSDIDDDGTDDEYDDQELGV